MLEYKCPYCGQDSYAKSSRKNHLKYDSWKCVRYHISTCISNDYKYLICLKYGPLLTEDISNLSYTQLNFKYPNTTIKLANVRDTLVRHGVYKNKAVKYWDVNNSIIALRNFYKTNNRLPQYREFDANTSGNYPSTATLKSLFGSFNKAIEAAGFKPSLQNGFGYKTYGNDSILYDSGLEAIFANKLKDNYQYEVHKKYPNGWVCDFYIEELNLYVEIDGKLRPKRIEEKITYCKENNLKLKILTKEDLNKDFNF